MRFIPTGYISFILFLLILGLSIGGAPVFIDPDTAWHIAAGDLIRSIHGIPLHDVWSFTASGQRWYNLSWLFDIGFSLLFASGGFNALYVFTILVFATSLVTMAHICIRRGASPIAVFIVTLLVIIVMYVGVLARPNMCSVVLTIAFYVLLYRYRTTRALKYILLLPLLMALWVNLHGGFLLAFLVMGLFASEAALQRDRALLRGYALAIALCGAATLINPYGFEIYYGAYRTLSGNFDKTTINEWLPVRIGQHYPMTLLLLCMLCISNAFDKRIALIDRLLAITLLMLSLTSIRHTIIASLLVMPYATLRITNLLADSRVGKKLREREAVFMEDMGQNSIRLMGMIITLGAVVFISTPWLRETLVHQTIGFPLDSYPGEEAIYIDEHYPDLRFFNHYDIGGYLDYLWRGKVKVFVDGRASSLYSEELLQDYNDFIASKGFGGRAEVIASQYHLEGLIIPNGSGGAAEWQWNPNWKVVYRGKVATVYVRSDIYRQSPAYKRELLNHRKS